MNPGIIYYTDFHVKEPFFSLAKHFILESGLPISSVSLNKPVDIGNNVIVEGERSYPTMIRQIIAALENSDTDYVFFCEHDVLYHKSHFQFEPPKSDVFYYNENIWRWWIFDDFAIRYDRMWSLSCLCANREFALEHYRNRWKAMSDLGFDKFSTREPKQARIWGYEPGTKLKRRGGFSDDTCDLWSSELPNIDIRHTRTFSPPKAKLKDFKHIPTGWQQISLNEIPGWNMKEMFN
jgi:hypothetical protein